MRWFSAPRSVNYDDMGGRIDQLSPKAFHAYSKLIRSYWGYGQLDVEDHDLAAICGIQVNSFRRLKVQIGKLFEIDAAGRWRDYDLEEERAAAMRRSAVNARNGAAGGRRRHGLESAPEAEAAVFDDQANAQAFACTTQGSDDGETALSVQANAVAFATPPAVSPGSIDRSLIKDSESIDRSTPCAGDGEGEANGLATAAPDASRNAAIDVPIALAPMSLLPMADAGPGDADLHAEVLAACGDNITAELRRSRDVEPIRALMRDGFDLRREILPLLRDRVKALRTPARTLRAPWIRDALQKARASGAAPPATVGTVPLVFVAAGTPDWDRWQAYGRASGKQPQGYPPSQEHAGKRGWRFPSLMPPPLDRPAAAAE